MTLADLGITDELTAFLSNKDLSGLAAGRVTREHRERYIVSTGEREYEAEITGNLRFSASSRTDFPAVGDWVTIAVYEPDLAIIHGILPRRSVLERQAIGRTGEKQLIATNIDVALILQSIDNNFNINRLERYLAICNSSGIEPVLIISKIDLASEEEIKTVTDELRRREKEIKYMFLSNFTGEGLDKINGLMEKRKTYCVVGSSGVGKSSLINNLLKTDTLKTGPISNSTNKGRHITAHRELLVLENGSIIIDNPGMKELGMTDDTTGIKITFREISDLSLKCKFTDCTHNNESGCAVVDALERGIIDADSLNNFRKLQREREKFQSTVAERHRKDREFGKMVRLFVKEKKRNKY